MKKVLLFATAMTALFATTSCSNEDNVINDEVDTSGKTRIALSGTDGDMAVSRAGFTAQTRIVARIVSDSRDDGGAKCVKTVLSAAAEASGAGYSNVSYNEGKTRYWDDAHGRQSRLSVYAVAIPNVNDATDESNLKESVLAGTDSWSTSAVENNSISWEVKTAQAAADLASQDLTYSNNIQDGNVGANGVYTWDYTNNKYPEFTPANATKHTKESVTDGRMYFTQSADWSADVTDAPGHFDKGQMEFHHALSRIQVNLKKGAGYTGTLSLTGNTLQLNKMPCKGSLNIKAGTWSDATSGNIKMASVTADDTEYTGFGKAELTYEAQMLPGYEFTDVNVTNAMQFDVDGNTYYITNAMLRKALLENGETAFTMAQEKRYIFNITVAKNKIENITATVAGWINVEAKDFEIDNSHITFQNIKSITGESCGMDDINFYKYEQELDKVYTNLDYKESASASVTKGKNFGDPATLSDENNDSKFETNWFYKDNKTAYHFRTLNNTAKATLDATNKNKFTMEAGDNVDYHWGAPMGQFATLKYDKTTGFQEQILYGIVAASKQTNLTITEIHMMSNIVVKLKTVEGGAAINVDGATVTITNLYTKADVDMGIGLITPNTLGNNVMTCGTGDKSKEHTYSVIPQDLKRTDTTPLYVGITIKTVDNNEYYVVADLSKIIAESSTSQYNQSANAAIETWFPGHTYTYTFTLSKKQIENITATVANWVNVVAGNTDLDLEK